MIFWVVDVIWFLKKEGFVLNILLKLEVFLWIWWMLLLFVDILYFMLLILNFVFFIFLVMCFKVVLM